MTARSPHPIRKGPRALGLLGLLVLLAGSLPLEIAGAAIRRPDLVVSSMTNPPARVARGGSFALTTTVKNIGRARAGASTLRFYLSRDRAKGASDKRLAQVRKIGRLLPGRISKGKTTLKPAVTIATGGWYVIACADDLKKVRESKEGNNCRASRGLEIVPGASTSDKIDAAVAAGTITEEQGLVYQTFAAFGDSRLPAQFRGDDAGSIHGGDLDDVTANFDTLSSTAKAALTPFLMPPAYPGTWEELSTASPNAVPTTRAHRSAPTSELASVPPMHPSPLGEDGWFLYQHAHANIWFRTQYPAHQVFAGQLFDAMDKVYPDLTGLMGTTPMSDAGPHPFIDKDGVAQVWGDGGSGTLDIYVMPISGATGALTVTYPPGCTGRPSFIVMDPYFKSTHANHARDALAHEFMHVLQYTHDYAAPCKDYQNMDEAVANWAIDYVYQTDNLEHDWNTYVWKNWIPSLAENDYDAWNFFLFLEHTVGPSNIANIYTAAEVMGPYDAIDTAITGGLADRFPEFLRRSWNHDPEPTHFQAWDGLALQPQLATDSSSTGTGPRQVIYREPFPMPMELPALGHAYYHLAFEDERIVRIKYENALAGNSNIDIRALALLENGTWLDEDWSGEDEVVWCRSKPAEDVQELILIVANTQFANLEETAKATSKVTTQGDCLPDSYGGTLSGTLQGANLPEQGYVPPTETWSGSVTFTRYTGPCSGEWWCYDNRYQSYKASAGSVNWSVAGGSPCSYNGGPFGLSIPPLDPMKGDEAFLLVRKRPPAGQTTTPYHGSIVKHDVQTITATCPDSDPIDMPYSPGSGWWHISEYEGFAADPGGPLTGTFSFTNDGDGEVTYNWSFAPQN